MTKSITGMLPSPGQRVEDLFEQVFKSHFKSLHSYAATLLRDPVPAEEVVQTIFMKWWEKRDQIDIKENISVYLYRAVHNESLNYLKHLKVRVAYQTHAMRRQNLNQSEKASDRLATGELEQRLEKALRELPEQCRTIFQLSRIDELKYREIADRLDLSVKTVENQMGKALRLLRLKLVDFLPLMTIVYITFYKDR